MVALLLIVEVVCAGFQNLPYSTTFLVGFSIVSFKSSTSLLLQCVIPISVNVLHHSAPIIDLLHLLRKLKLQQFKKKIFVLNTAIINRSLPKWCIHLPFSSTSFAFRHVHFSSKLKRSFSSDCPEAALWSTSKENYAVAALERPPCQFSGVRWALWVMDVSPTHPSANHHVTRSSLKRAAAPSSSYLVN